ncbi:pepsin-like aspartyl protease [Pseudomonas sp.]|uniref:pepsin-like aspartyl protease n=1 Tax=Pseudomonas sp. TaxID=306 RepID=UPI00262015C4|nr:pepsin-like aspartyl protease [Pseudomonas sp.]
MPSPSLENGLVFHMYRGPLQNNGATAWYSPLQLGTPGQPLKLALDTGTNITWATSTLCQPDQCQHYSAKRFNYQRSRTFAFTDCLQRPYSFGPWGTMQVEAGSDVLTLPNKNTMAMNVFLAARYSGEQFRQLDWDGGIGLPSSSAYAEERNSFLFLELLRNHVIDPVQPYVCFDWDPATHRGTCRMGALDMSKLKGPHLFLPWSAYTTVPGVEYIWSSGLSHYSVGGETLATDIGFALDSGSSQFKGDDTLMRKTLQRIALGGNPDVVLGFEDGEITLGADLYNVLIEEGPQKGQTIPQFAPLGLTDLVLVGSLVMEQCYTVYEYRVVQCKGQGYSLAPVGIWLFNRPDGPQIITRPSKKTFTPGPRAVTTERVSLVPPASKPTPSTPQPHQGSVAGTWTNDYGSLMTLSVYGQHVFGFYQSSTGSVGLYEVTGYQLHAPATPEMSQPVALAIEWHSVGEGPADPSWNWSSSLYGQISLEGTEEVLTLSHLLVASSDFPALAGAGTYADRLVYRRSTVTPHGAPAPVPSVPKRSISSLTGTWMAHDGTAMKLHIEAESEGRFGRIHGSLVHASKHFQVSGFTDINAAASGLSHQSLAITAAYEDSLLTLCGTLRFKEDSLALIMMTGVATSPAHTYVQTRISALTFKRWG